MYFFKKVKLGEIAKVISTQGTSSRSLTASALVNGKTYNLTVSGASAPSEEETQYAFYEGKLYADRLKKLTELASLMYTL